MRLIPSCAAAACPRAWTGKNDYFWVSLLNQLLLIAGGVAGALLGSVLPFDTTGIDFDDRAVPRRC